MSNSPSKEEKNVYTDQLSDCCQAPYRSICADEGTCHAECTKCGETCGFYSPSEKKCEKCCWEKENPHRCGKCCKCGTNFSLPTKSVEWRSFKEEIFELVGDDRVTDELVCLFYSSLTSLAEEVIKEGEKLTFIRKYPDGSIGPKQIDWSNVLSLINKKLMG